MLTLPLLLVLFSALLPEVRTQATQSTGSAQRDTHGLFNVYFIPAYRVATNRTLKSPPPNTGLFLGAGLLGQRQKSTTPERSRISGAASDVYPEKQALSQATGAQQQPALPLRTQASAITQYLLGFRNGYQHQQYQQANRYQQPNGFQQHTPLPPGYYPLPTRSTQDQQYQGYYPFPAVYIPPSIIPKSATEPPPLPAINSNTGNYRASASVNNEAIVKSTQISVIPTLVTGGPVYATAADEIQTTIEPAANSILPEATVTPSESTTKKLTTIPPETPKTSVAPTTTHSDSKTSPAQEERTSASPDKHKTPESMSTEKAKAEEHRSISRHFEFSEDKEHSQVNATGDIRLTASRKTSEEESTQKPTSAPAAQGLPPPFPTFNSLPLNTPHPHSHPHPAIIQGPNGYFVGSYNPTNQVGAIPPPVNSNPYNPYSPFGHSADYRQGGFPVHPTFPTRYEDLYYGFAPGYPFGVLPNNNASAANVVQPGPAPQPIQQKAPPPNQQLPPNQPFPVYPGPPRQFFDVAGPRQAPYTSPQQNPYSGFNAQPIQSPEDYSRFSNEGLQSSVGRPFYPGDTALANQGYSGAGGLPNRGYTADNPLPNRGYAGETGNTGLPNRLYTDPSGPSAPARLYNADPGALNPDPLFNRGFGGGPPPFLAPGFARSDSVEANSGVSNFVNPVRGIGTAYEIKPGPDSLTSNYERRVSRRDSTEADGDSDQVVY